MQVEHGVVSLTCLEVGTHSISPLYWAIESGSLAAAEAEETRDELRS